MALNDNREPMRRCIGCRKSHPKREMFRFTCHGMEIYEDTTGNDEGRGVYLCKSESCIDSARKNRAFNRAYKRAIDDKSLGELLGKMQEKTRR